MTEALATRAPSALETLLADPDRLKSFPIETVERLFDLSRKMAADIARKEFAEAFNRLQGRMTPVRRTATNDQTRSKYALLEDVERMLDPLLISEGFSRSMSTEDCPVPDHLRFVMTLRHVGGHTERHVLDAPIDDKGPKGASTKTRLHGMGSSMTYVSRYLLVNVCGVQTCSDDDGNAAGNVGPGADSITERQAADLYALMEETGSDPDKFMVLYGVAKLEALSAANLAGAINTLEQRRRMQGER